MTNAFPLSWPQGYRRTGENDRKKAAFKKKFGAAVGQLISELKRLGAQYVVISTNVKVKSDGLPYATEPNPKDPGVAVYFEWNRKPMVLACDKWKYVEDNIHAIGLTVGAMRGLERWGVSSMLERAFQGFVALPAPEPAEEPWYKVLGVMEDAPIEDIEAIYKVRCKQTHPDAGGSSERQAAVNLAMEKARRVKGEYTQGGRP